MIAKYLLEVKNNAHTHQRNISRRKRLCVRIVFKRNYDPKISFKTSYFRNRADIAPASTTHTADIKFRLKPFNHLHLEDCQFRIRPYSGCSMIKPDKQEKALNLSAVNNKSLSTKVGHTTMINFNNLAIKDWNKTVYYQKIREHSKYKVRQNENFLYKSYRKKKIHNIWKKKLYIQNTVHKHRSALFQENSNKPLTKKKTVIRIPNLRFRRTSLLDSSCL